MPTFKVYARQWVEEIGEAEIEADTRNEALRMAEEEDPDWDWSDGNDVQDFEVTGAEQLDGDDEPDEDEPEDEPEGEEEEPVE